MAEGNAGGERERDEGTGGERESVGGRDGRGERNFYGERKKNFFFRPARERGWRKGGRDGERKRDEGTGGRKSVGGRNESRTLTDQPSPTTHLCQLDNLTITYQNGYNHFADRLRLSLTLL